MAGIKIQDVLDTLRVPHVGAEHKHGRAGWVQVDCPKCGRGSQKYHLGISLTTGKASCWRCGKLYTPSVLADITGQSARSIAKLLGGVHLQAPSKVKHSGKLVLPKGRVPLMSSKAHVNYARSRGFNPEVLEDLWGVEAIGQAPRLSWRLFVPVQLYGDTVSWTTRAIGARASMRWIAAPEAEEAIPGKSLLYGEDHALHAIVVVEGAGDAWAIGPGAVATCGTSYSPAQVLRMSKYPVRAVCFDNEPEAQQRAEALCDDLGCYPGDTYNIQLDAGDPGEASDREIRQLRKAIFK